MNNVFAVAGVVIKELYRRKDFYVLFVMTALVTLILGAVNFFDDDKVVRYVKEICLLLIWISSLVIAVTIAARQIPAERESRAIFPLLAKPISRAQLVLGKFTGCWLACGAALLIFYVFFCILSGTREHSWPLLDYFQAFWLHWVCLALVVSLVLLGSVILTAQSANATLSFIIVVAILFGGSYLNQGATQIPGIRGALLSALYYLIPHLEWYDVRDLISQNLGAMNWLVCAGATLYGALYAACLLSLAWIAFRRQPLNL